MLCMEIISIARHEQYNRAKKILSIDKCLKTILERKKIIELVSCEKMPDIINVIKKLFQLFTANHWQEKRINRDNFEDLFDLFTCKSNI